MPLLKRNGKLVTRNGKLVVTDNPATCSCCGPPPPPSCYCCVDGEPVSTAGCDEGFVRSCLDLGGVVSPEQSCCPRQSSNNGVDVTALIAEVDQFISSRVAAGFTVTAVNRVNQPYSVNWVCHRAQALQANGQPCVNPTTCAICTGELLPCQANAMPGNPLP